MSMRHEFLDTANKFGLVAQQYCSFIDFAATADKTEFLLRLYRALPELVTEAIRLPHVEFGEDNDEELEASLRQIRAETRMKQEEWDRLYNSLKEKLGDWDLYWQVFDPRTDNEAIHGSLADDIADIYRDLINGIRLKETDQVPPYEIIFDWRLGFFSHWGKHAIDALRTIHFLLEGHAEA
jgi:Domain of unknown function (DUF5063)